ncbi:hypothetical protein CWS01_21665 [Niallia nealsonii]|uniref:Uncharacterized protein n=1 Tax=Niallia nealsonii TaxID=115979 RepID=A0A2N0YWF5_9BACI|nr:hypothetical protein CWS01_21665 [Niallia nealsonii]
MDWAEGLEHETSVQAILIYVMKKAALIAEQVNKQDHLLLAEKIIKLEEASKQHLWDSNKPFL